MMNRGIWSVFLVLLTLTPAGAQLNNRIDLTNFVVVGEGLAAGYTNFALQEVYQNNAFPAVMARQMSIKNFPQFLFQAPGMGNIAGFPALPVRAPGNLQDTVRLQGGPKPTGRVNAQPPFAIFGFNVSIPGNKVADALSRRPVPPLFQTNDVQQTLINMTIGFPGMVTGVNRPLWTQAEYARNMNASFGLIAMGYYDFVDAVARGDASLLPTQAKFKTDFAQLISTVVPRGVPFVMATIPDPIDSGFVMNVGTVAQILSYSTAALGAAYPALKPDDLITIPGLMLMGSQLLAGTPTALPPGSTVSPALASQVSARVTAVNSDITALAQQLGMPLVDLRALFNSIRLNGLVANGRLLTAQFQGGLYSFDGFYPGSTMHAVIANEFLGVINKTYGLSYPLVDVNATAASDGSARMIPMARPHKSEIQ
jgi:hypothetical protein